MALGERRVRNSEELVGRECCSTCPYRRSHNRPSCFGVKRRTCCGPLRVWNGSWKDGLCCPSRLALLRWDLATAAGDVLCNRTRSILRTAK